MTKPRPSYIIRPVDSNKKIHKLAINWPGINNQEQNRVRYHLNIRLITEAEGKGNSIESDPNICNYPAERKWLETYFSKRK